MGSGDQIQSAGLCGKNVYLWSCLLVPEALWKKSIMENLDLLAGSTGARHVIDTETAAHNRYAIFWINIQINLERKLARM